MDVRFRPGRLLGSGARWVIVVVLAMTGAVCVIYPRHVQSLLRAAGDPLAGLLSVPLQRMAVVDRDIRNWWERYADLRDVAVRNRELEERVERLETALNRWRERALALERRSVLLKFQRRMPVKTVAARVIGRSASNWYQGVILDKGEDDGVHVGMGVTTPAGVVGRIVKTGGATSIVLLLTDANVSVAGLVQRTREEGIVQGTSGGHVRMAYLPAHSSVAHGDVVVTSGLTGAFPRGVLVGRVSQAQHGERTLFQIADVVPVVNFQRLEDVLVITAPRPPEAAMILDRITASPAP